MSQHTVAVIQARMGSSRLPGKVLLPLNCEHVLAHDVRRVRKANSVNKVVIATSTKSADDIIEQFGERYGVSVYRGSEKNVQQRIFDTATAYDAETVVRITADCPLIDPETVDTVVSRLHARNAEYASNTLKRTFPRGLDVEAFNHQSFKRVVSAATTKREREHVTPYYLDHPEEFNTEVVTSDDVFDDEQYIDRTDIRLTLDEAADYKLLGRVYNGIEYTDTLPIKKVIKYIDAEELYRLNESVQQKEL